MKSHTPAPAAPAHVPTDAGAAATGTEASPVTQHRLDRVPLRRPDVVAEPSAGPLQLSAPVRADLQGRRSPVEIGARETPDRTLAGLAAQAARGDTSRARREGDLLVVAGLRDPSLAAREHTLSGVGRRLSDALPYRRFRLSLDDAGQAVLQGKVNPWVNLRTGMKSWTTKSGGPPDASGDWQWESRSSRGASSATAGAGGGAGGASSGAGAGGGAGAASSGAAAAAPKKKEKSAATKLAEAHNARMAAEAASVAAAPPTPDEELGKRAELAGMHAVAAQRRHQAHRAAAAEPTSTAAHTLQMLAIPDAPPAATGGGAAGAGATASKYARHKVSVGGEDVHYQTVPAAKDAQSRGAQTAVTLRGVGPSSKYPAMAARGVHPAAAADPTHKVLTTLEAVGRSGGRDAASAAAKASSLSHGGTPAAQIDERHATFEMAGAQRPRADQRRLIRRNAGAGVREYGSPAAPSAAAATTTAASSGAASTAAASSGAAPSFAPPSPTGAALYGALQSWGDRPSREDMAATAPLLWGGMRSFAPASPLGEDSLDEAYDEVEPEIDAEFPARAAAGRGAGAGAGGRGAAAPKKRGGGGGGAGLGDTPKRHRPSDEDDQVL